MAVDGAGNAVTAAIAAEPMEIGAVPFVSAVEPTFWHALADMKLNSIGLREEPLDVAGFCEPARASFHPSGLAGGPPAVPPCLHLTSSSLSSTLSNGDCSGKA